MKNYIEGVSDDGWMFQFNDGLPQSNIHGKQWYGEMPNGWENLTSKQKQETYEKSKKRIIKTLSKNSSSLTRE